MHCVICGNILHYAVDADFEDEEEEHLENSSCCAVPEPPPPIYNTPCKYNLVSKFLKQILLNLIQIFKIE